MVLIAIFLSVMSPSVPNINNGETLYHSCKAAIRLADDPQRFPDSELPLTADCTAYLAGFGDAGTQYGAFCLGTTTLLTLARVYVAYKDAHPTLFDKPQKLGVMGAFSESYSCPVSK